MRVGIITERYPPNVKGGGEISVHLLARGLKERGLDVEVLSFDGRGESSYEGIKVKRFPTGESSHFPIEKSNLLAYPAITGFSRGKDILHGYNMRYYPATVRASRSLGLHSVLTMTTYGYYYPYHVDGLKDPETLLGRAHQRISDGMARRIIDENADALILLSRAQMSIYEEAGFRREKMRVIPNFIDPQFLTHAVTNASAGQKKILYVGRLSHEKGLETLIRAFGIVRSSFNDLQLVIVGTGPLVQSLENLVASLGMESSVEFTGEVDYPNVREFYNNAFLFVHPGLWPEPFGRSILEAMGSGVPVIASDVGSAPELLGDCGVLFEPGDALELANQIERIVTDSDLHQSLSRDGLRRAAERFSPEPVIDRILALYNQVISKEAVRPRQKRRDRISAHKERWVRSVRHRCGRVLDRTVVPAGQGLFSLYFNLFRRYGSRSDTDIQRILLVMFTQGIGDAVLCTPALNALRHSRPGSEITVVGIPYIEDLVRHFEAVDKFIPFNAQHARISDVYRLVRRLRRLRLDVAFDVLADRSVLSAFLSFVSGARDVAGFSTGFRSVFFNIRCPRETKPIHFADSLRNLVSEAGLGRGAPIFFETNLAGEKDRMFAASLLSGRPRPVFCVHPGSRGAREFRWPPDLWVSLLRTLREVYDCTILMVGSKKEKGLCQYLVERLDGDAIDLAGRCTIGQTAALIRESDLLLSIASGPLHMAVAMSVPAVYIGGGVDLVRWGAYGSSVLHRAVLLNEYCRPEFCRSCSRRTGECAESIPTETVLRAVKETMNMLGMRAG